MKATFIKADINKLEDVLTPYKFDLIYLFGMIHKNQNPDNVFKKISNYMENIENQ